MCPALKSDMPIPFSQPDPIEPRSGPVRLLSKMSDRPAAWTASDRLREAARALDRGAQSRHEVNAERAIWLWEGLVQGRSEVIDWFDSDGRRFIIARLRSETRGGSRGLTDRERQVALRAARGESSKLTGYRLGISPSRVSALLKAAMRKLGVSSKVQLVVMVRLLRGESARSPTTPEEAKGHG